MKFLNNLVDNMYYVNIIKCWMTNSETILKLQDLNLFDNTCTLHNCTKILPQEYFCMISRILNSRVIAPCLYKDPIFKCLATSQVSGQDQTLLYQIYYYCTYQCNVLPDSPCQGLSPNIN